jgi:hypothetical protein
MQKRKIYRSLALVIITALSSGIARAEYVSSSGVACKGQGNGGNIDYTDYLKVSIGGVTVVCPLSPGQIGSNLNVVTQVIVRYADYSAISAVSCIVARINFAGTRTESAMRYTCATPGGCDTMNPSYTGIGNYLSIEIPGGPIAQDDSVTLECTIPSGDSYGHPSGIISYYLQ